MTDFTWPAEEPVRFREAAGVGGDDVAGESMVLAGERPVYDGRAGKLAGIAFSNALLTILTLGIYRFWGIARMRRYLWSRVSFLGDRLEYRGRGWEKLVGFLIAMLTFVPVGLLAVGIAMTAAFPQGLVLPIVLLYLQIIVLTPVAIYLGRRYRLQRTAWRGIRFDQGGSALAYMRQFLGWGFLAALTLSVLWPVMNARLWGYKWRHTSLGTARFDHPGRSNGLVGVWLGCLLLAPFTLGLSLYWYSAIQYRRLTGDIRLGDLRIASTLSMWRLVWPVFRFMLAVLVVNALVLGGGFIAAGGPALITAPGVPDDAAIQMLTFVLVGLGILVVGPITATLHAVLVLHPVTRAVCAALTAEGMLDLSQIRQDGTADAGPGEGLANLLDVGG